MTLHLTPIALMTCNKEQSPIDFLNYLFLYLKHTGTNISIEGSTLATRRGGNEGKKEPEAPPSPRQLVAF